METKNTPQQVAEWMFDEVKQRNSLYQEDVVHEIAAKFGKEFTYDNENGNLAISRKVLAAFTKLTKDTVVWERFDKCWNLRKLHDSPGRRQD
jgi:hypothetical protein